LASFAFFAPEDHLNIPMKQYWHLLVNYLRPQWPRVATLTLLLAATIGLQLVRPQIIRAFIDAAQAGGLAQQLTRAALVYLAAAVALQIFSFAATYFSENVAWTSTNALRRDLTAHCLRLDMSFHKAHTPGELIERIDGDVTVLANFFSQMAIRLLSNGLLALGIVIILYLEDWRVGLVAAGYAGLTALSSRTVQVAAVTAWNRSRQTYSEFSGFLGERLAATEDIRANGGDPYVMQRLYGLMRNVFHAWRRAKMVQALSRALGAVAYLVTLTVTLAIGIRSYLNGQMTLGTVYLLMHYLALLRAPLVEIRNHVDDLQRASASIERIQALLNAQPRVIETPRAGVPPGRPAELPSGALRVAFEDVTFGYDDAQAGNGCGRERVLEDISFALKPGRVLGLLGRTGSGKTTLTRLLFRLYDPTAGTIRLGDVELQDVRLSDLRRRIGLVTQDVQLFRATVRHNVSLFSSRVSDEQILDALRALGLGEWYDSLPDGLDTVLESGANSLSAGQAQLLAFTRVFLKDPGVIVLDEASSRLDLATEQLLERAIDRLLEGRTAIVIAHRLATVGRVDEIIVLEEGRIGERGAREALAGDPTSRFYRLLQTGLEEVLA
jgi:ATP-binding cassette subfamily B protein/ATP-binding cassette subfamily C protein